MHRLTVPLLGKPSDGLYSIAGALVEDETPEAMHRNEGMATTSVSRAHVMELPMLGKVWRNGMKFAASQLDSGSCQLIV